MMVNNRRLELGSRSGLRCGTFFYIMGRQSLYYQGQKTGGNDCLLAQSHLSTNFVGSYFVQITNNKQPSIQVRLSRDVGKVLW